MSIVDRGCRLCRCIILFDLIQIVVCRVRHYRRENEPYQVYIWKLFQPHSFVKLMGVGKLCIVETFFFSFLRYYIRETLVVALIKQEKGLLKNEATEIILINTIKQ